MIDDSGAVIPDSTDINKMIDDQFKEKAAKEKLFPCGQCDYFGNWEQMEFHKRGAHGIPT